MTNIQPITFLNPSLGALCGIDVIAKLVLNTSHVGLYATFRHRTDSTDWPSGPLLLEKIINGISDVSVLRSIDLGACQLESLPVATIANLKFLSEISVEGSFVTINQARALLRSITDGSRVLKFHLGRESIIDVETASDMLAILEPRLVALALNKFEHLCYNKISCDDGDCRKMEPDVHLEAFLLEMGIKTNLKHINMGRNIYFHIPPAVVAKAFNNLENLELVQNTCIETNHMLAIFDLMVEETNVMNLRFDRDDISRLHPEIMARAVMKLNQVDFYCKMSGSRIRALLSQLSSLSKIKRLNLGPNDISKIPEHIVDNAGEVLRRNGGSVIFVHRNEKKFMCYK